jgi:hypothetical protein
MSEEFLEQESALPSSDFDLGRVEPCDMTGSFIVHVIGKSQGPRLPVLSDKKHTYIQYKIEISHYIITSFSSSSSSSSFFIAVGFFLSFLDYLMTLSALRL